MQAPARVRDQNFRHRISIASGAGWDSLCVAMLATTPTIASGAALADGVLVINLDHRPERLVRFAAMAADFPQLAEWERLPAVNGVDLPGFGQPPWFRGGKRDKCWAGRAGCTLSHRKAVARAKQAGWQSVLILEDDALFDPGAATALDKLQVHLPDNNPPWGVCYLGFTKALGPAVRLAELAGARELFRVSGCYTTHAYLVHRSAYNWILDRLPTETGIWPWLARHRAVDRWYARHLHERFPVLAVSPVACGQVCGFSDIGQRDDGAGRADEFAEGVPAAAVVEGSARFARRSAMRRAAVMAEGWFDWCRGLRKRMRGF